jgi:glycosyltransferase involved in cell wall biosynthesis
MKYTKTDVKILITGNPDSVEYLEHLKSLIKENRLDEKVKIIDKWISLEYKIELFANTLATLFIPYDEDYGYVSLESFYAKKPVITCTDSGGTLEFVNHNTSGFVVPPDPILIAETLDKIYSNKILAKKMGESGYENLTSISMTWDNVIKRLTE